MQHLQAESNTQSFSWTIRHADVWPGPDLRIRLHRPGIFPWQHKSMKLKEKGKRDLPSHSVKMHMHRWATHMGWTGQQRKTTISSPRQELEVRLCKARLEKSTVVDRICGLLCNMDFTSGGKDRHRLRFGRSWWSKEKKTQLLEMDYPAVPSCKRWLNCPGCGSWQRNMRQCPIQASQCSSLQE